VPLSPSVPVSVSVLVVVVLLLSLSHVVYVSVTRRTIPVHTQQHRHPLTHTGPFDEPDTSDAVVLVDEAGPGVRGRFKGFLVLLVGFIVVVCALVSGTMRFPLPSRTTVSDTGYGAATRGGEIHGFGAVTLIRESQFLFDEGMLHFYGFNKPEALSRFQEAIHYDPSCVMCYWGLAAACGPTINDAVSNEDYEQGKEAIEAAQALVASSKSSTLELSKMLVAALSERYALSLQEWRDSGGWPKMEAGYVQSMRDVLRDCPPGTQKDTVTALLAAGLLNMTPWKYFSAPAIPPSPHTRHLGKFHDLNPSAREAYNLLAPLVVQSTGRNTNSLALHLLIHLAEQTTEPAVVGGEIAADLLFHQGTSRQAAGGLPIGHLLHMPAHIYLRVGRYSDCLHSSRAAISADQDYAAAGMSPYLPSHNLALAVACAVHDGDLFTAMQYSKRRSLEMSAAEANKFMSSMVPVPIDLVLTRFGRWSTILESAHPANDFHDVPSYSLALYHYSQTLAMIHTGDIDGAAHSTALLDDAVANIPTDSKPPSHVFYPYHREMGSLLVMLVRAAMAVSVAEKVIVGRNWVEAVNQYATAERALDMAMTIQDDFHYMEPEHFHLPIRQCAATLHLRTTLLILSIRERNFIPCSPTERTHECMVWTRYGNLTRARELFSQDLEVHPRNSRSLAGLQEVNRANQIFAGYYDSESVSYHPQTFPISFFNTLNINPCSELGQ